MLRWTRILFFLFILVSLSWYGDMHNPAVTLPMCLANPGKYDGTLVEIGTEVIVRQISQDGFVIHQLGVVLPVMGDPAGLKVGDFVVLTAIFKAPNQLRMLELYAAKGRRWKIAVSLVPAIFILFPLIRRYRFNYHLLILKERSSA